MSLHTPAESGLALGHFNAGYPKRQVIHDLTVPHLPCGFVE
ncbi:hypothetical protein [Raoultella sp. XY-1]